MYSIGNYALDTVMVGMRRPMSVIIPTEATHQSIQLRERMHENNHWTESRAYLTKATQYNILVLSRVTITVVTCEEPDTVQTSMTP